MADLPSHQLDLHVGGKYRLRKKIGSGLFGAMYLGINTISGQGAAIKLGSVEAKHPQLEYGSKVYKTPAGGVGVPFVCWFATECDHNAMVVDLLGPSLEDLFNFCHRKFSVKTVLLADQLVCNNPPFVLHLPGLFALRLPTRPPFDSQPHRRRRLPLPAVSLSQGFPIPLTPCALKLSPRPLTASRYAPMPPRSNRPAMLDTSLPLPTLLPALSYRTDTNRPRARLPPVEQRVLGGRAVTH
uniref:Glycolipid 2-alpha-mannosyltransferase 2 ) n=1 Tax=Ganoderma boninense TaxID=34458 RepID=A0A5K1K5R3_9APHY|nr:Glycolipid 2-alpha-mannosyltransferase 2 (EC (Alpha-1,2-mannosyltransferase 2) [Ganoderma boninense]